ncbi:unnamed protein product [Sphenostylis stenocarpa]|uniref:Uncharacterized protein n=1 Tax=Sphenostylis stenocarpa TaxID=92480 RepID=A0AA86SZX3_9FABA|nr:unnamed protein product [Sphenostylis stenocarpa]
MEFRFTHMYDVIEFKIGRRLNSAESKKTVEKVASSFATKIARRLKLLEHELRWLFHSTNSDKIESQHDNLEL